MTRVTAVRNSQKRSVQSRLRQLRASQPQAVQPTTQQFQQEESDGWIRKKDGEWVTWASIYGHLSKKERIKRQLAGLQRVFQMSSDAPNEDFEIEPIDWQFEDID